VLADERRIVGGGGVRTCRSDGLPEAAASFQCFLNNVNAAILQHSLVRRYYITFGDS